MRPFSPITAIIVREQNMRKLNPQVLWKASGTISDPEIVSGRMALASTGSQFEGPKVVPSPTRIDLFDGRYVLLFRDDQLVLFLSPDDIEAFPYYLLQYYVCYQSRVHYNILSVPLGIDFPLWLRQKKYYFASRDLFSWNAKKICI